MIIQPENLSSEYLHWIADRTVELCKEMLLEDGYICRKCLLFCPAINIIRYQHEFPIEQYNPETRATEKFDTKVDPASIVGAFIDLGPDDAGLLLMLEIVEPRLKEILPEIYAALKDRAPSELIPKLVIERIMAIKGVGPNWIVTRFIRQIIQRLDAYAYIQYAEAWTATVPEGERDTLERSLEEEPSATEALIVSMETRTEQMLITVPFDRAERGKGKVLRFGEKHVTKEAFGPMFNILKSLPMN